MNYHATQTADVSDVRSTRERIADMLARYPKVNRAEAREILLFLRKGRHLDVGLLTSNEKLRPNLDVFMDDHKDHFRVRWGEGTAVVAGLAALLAVVWLVWEAFA